VPYSRRLVVNVEAALKGERGFSRIPTGLFPREFALSADGKTLLVSDYASGMVQAVNVSQLTLN
jgi:DNA-binding beta-propeller fold protein YncE